MAWAFSSLMATQPLTSQKTWDWLPWAAFGVVVRLLHGGTLEHVFAIAEDDAGNIWFGDRDTGAWKYDGQSMTNYGIADGLPTLSIWDIHKDRHGTILVALDNGVVCRFLNGAFEPVFPRRQSADQ